MSSSSKTISSGPVWMRSLLVQHGQGVGRIFILHGNINDLVYYPIESNDYLKVPRPFRHFLVYGLLKGLFVQTSNSENSVGPFGPVVYVSPTIPPTLYYLDESWAVRHVLLDEAKFREHLQNWCHGSQGNFAQQVRSDPIPRPPDIVSFLLRFEELMETSEGLVVILDFLEKITPRDDTEGRAEEIIRRLALSHRLKRTRNMLIGLTVSQDALSRFLMDSHSGIMSIHVPLPTVEERETFLCYWKNPLLDYNLKLQMAAFEGEEDGNEGERIKHLAGLSRGFRLVDLEAMVRLAKVRHPEGHLSLELFKEHKARIIREQSDQILEEISPEFSFDDIGGLEYAKNYFKRVAKMMGAVQGDASKAKYVPKGVLLVGPPGTGKTILAQAVAREARTNLVRMGDIRGPYVGQSEMRMSATLRLLKELAPVVVFVDEIDQTLGRRSEGLEGDSGVNRRLFGKLLEFMGNDDYRGDVLWIAATNRPDLLDEAMLSRFDTVMAIVPPYDVEDRASIIETMASRFQMDFDEGLKANLKKVAEAMGELPGRAISTLMAKAADLAAGKAITTQNVEEAIKLYKPNLNQRSYDEQTIRALIAVNFTDMMPPCNVFPKRLAPYVEQAIREKSNMPLEECLRLIMDPQSAFYLQSQNEGMA